MAHNLDMVPVLRATIKQTITTLREMNALLQDWKQVAAFCDAHPTMDRMGKELISRVIRLVDVEDKEI